MFLSISILSCFWYHILCICLSAPRIPIDGLFFFLARACGPELLVDYSDRRIMFLLRIANHLVMDSRCRGGIVHIRGGCSRVRLVRPRKFQGALAVSCKYFKQSKWPYLAAINTQIRYIHHTHAQQDIRVCGDDHF